MAVKVEVRGDESLVSALARFNKTVKIEYRRNWAKRRFGHYEKPSVLRRRQAEIDEISHRREGLGAFRRNIHFREQFKR